MKGKKINIIGIAPNMATNIPGFSEIPKGKDVYYKCIKCSDLVPSIPAENDNSACRCGNIIVDVDYCRLAVEDFSMFQALLVEEEKDEY